jgi:rubrerythrin
MALEAFAQGKGRSDVSFYLSAACNNVEFGKTPESSPVCGAKFEKFVKGCSLA